TQDLELVAVPHAEGRRRPLADAVDREDGRLLPRARVEGRGGVRLVVLAVEERALVAPEGLADDRADPELLLEPHGHGLDEALEAPRSDPEVGLDDPLELEERLVVK